MTKKLNKWQKEIIKLAETQEQDAAVKLQAAYNDLLKDVRKELKRWLDLHNYEELPDYRLAQIATLFTIDNKVAEIIRQSGERIEPIINEYKGEALKQGYYTTFYQIEQEGKLRLNFRLLDEGLVRRSVAEPVKGELLSSRLYRNTQRLAKKATSSVRNGLMMGKSYAQIAHDIAQDGQASKSQAMTIARTEGGRLRSIGRQEGRDEAVSMGIRLQKRWVSTLDMRTRSSHGALDGQVVDSEGFFTTPEGYKAKYPRGFGVAKEDINCRCEAISQVEGIEPSVRKDNETKEVISYKTYQDWYRGRV